MSKSTDPSLLVTEADIRERALSIPAFCMLEDISLTSFYKMRKLGAGPLETRIPGTSVVRITPEARRKWHEDLAQLQQSEDAKLEGQRRSELASIKGKKAAASPKHVSNRRRRA